MGCARGNVKARAATALTLAMPVPIASTGLAGAEALVARREEVLQRRGGRAIDDPVAPLRAEMALERSHDVAGGAIEIAAGGDVVAVFRQQRLRLFDGGIGFAKREDRSRRVDGGGFDPQADAGIGQRLPWKSFAGIALARGRDVRMGEHAVGGDPMAGGSGKANRWTPRTGPTPT